MPENDDSNKTRRRSGFLSLFGLRHRDAPQQPIDTEVVSFFARPDEPGKEGAPPSPEAIGWHTETPAHALTPEQPPAPPSLTAASYPSAESAAPESPPEEEPRAAATETTPDQNTLAYRDPLTELPNRRATQNCLEEALRTASRNGRSVGVAFIDIDGFKQINDNLGHTAGDAVLVEIASRFRSIVRSGEIITRYGGDEFAALYPSIGSPVELSDAVCRLQAAFDRPFNIDGHRVDISLSIGVAQYPTDAQSAIEIISCADEAMYLAKLQGKSKICWFSAELGEKLSARRDMLERLNDPAVFSQLFLCYQPIVDVPTQGIVAAEALLRWQHPTLGLVNASRILDVVGRIPFAVEAWVIGTALSHAAAWMKADAPLRISLNLSKADVSTFKRLTESLELTGIDPKYLTVEVPENVASADSGSAIRFAQECADHGIDVALDRFRGTLSLTDLERLPVTAVKLAPDLIAGIRSETDEASQLLSAVVNVARSFDLTMVATGVERSAQQRLLQKAGLRLMQGYGKCAPMNHVDFADWLIRTTDPGTSGASCAGA